MLIERLDRRLLISLLIILFAFDRSDGHAIKVSSFPDSSSSSSSSTRSESLSSLRLRCDRFRAYLILSKLNGPWLAQLQQILMKDKSEEKGGNPSTESTSISSFNSSHSPLSPPIHLAVQFCVAFHFNDYSRFFKLYRRVCQPDDDQYYEPIVMALLQVSVRCNRSCESGLTMMRYD